MTDVAVTDLIIAKQRINVPFRAPINVPQFNVKQWHGRLGLVLTTNADYAVATGIPAATLSGDAITAGVLYEMGCKRLTDLIAFNIHGGLMHTGGKIHVAAEIAAATQTYTKGSGTWLTGMQPVAGDYVVGSAFTNAGNNGLKTVVASTTSTVVVSGTALTTESGGSDEQLTLFKHQRGGANIALPAGFDYELAAIRLNQIDVAVADTADHLEEALAAALTGATYFGGVAAFCDVSVTFKSSDGT